MAQLQEVSPFIPVEVRAAAASHAYPLLFATVSGAHLYGFPSPDSDWDLRGVHLLPPEGFLGLEPGEETVERTWREDGLELDLVTHDARKFFGLLMRRNGYVLEQLYSPWVVQGGVEFEALKEIARGCITRHHVHHYQGFFHNQWKLFRKESPPRVKPLLYVYRVLLTGIHLMQTGEVQADLNVLNQRFQLGFLDELICMKREGAEQGRLPEGALEFHEHQTLHLLEMLVKAHVESALPEQPSAGPALNDLLIQLRKTAMLKG